MNEVTLMSTGNPPTKRRVLVVEDNRFTGTVYKNVLEKEGFEVVYVADGKDAFNAILDQKFDLVLLDLMLPEMDGLEILQRVHERDQHFQTPVVVLSEVNLELVRQQVRRYGVNEFFTKTGADALKIVEAIKALVSQPAPADSEGSRAAAKAACQAGPGLKNLGMAATPQIKDQKLAQVYSVEADYGIDRVLFGEKKFRRTGAKPWGGWLKRFLFLW
jgi:CheY-like chemotaxis protein